MDTTEMEEALSLEQTDNRHSPRSPDSPPRSSSPETTMTTPDQSAGEDDDIWDTSSDHFPTQHHDPESASLPAHTAVLSDLPALRRQHMTEGYREGLSVGKARVMQPGFDAGYPLGVEVGLRVGNVLGALEGVIGALTSAKSKTRSGKPKAGPGEGGTTSSSAAGAEVGIALGEEPQGDGKEGGARDEEGLQLVRTMYARALQELKISELLKGLDDEKIAAIPNAHAQNSKGDEAAEILKDMEETVSLPKNIEDVLSKWERSVLGALHKKENEEGTSAGTTREMTSKLKAKANRRAGEKEGENIHGLNFQNWRAVTTQFWLCQLQRN